MLDEDLFDGGSSQPRLPIDLSELIMGIPFQITLFAKTGDPQGIRHVEKSNWSGFGVVFAKDQFHLLKDEPGFNQAGVYILVGNAAEETIYIGEADPVGSRLKNHVANKEGWAWGVYFVGKIGKTEVQFLESALVAKAKQVNRAIVLNKNSPTEPTMSAAARATAQAFLDDVLLILPMLGINAFTPGKVGDVPGEHVQPVTDAKTGAAAFDTIVVPAREEGFQKVFIGENRWYAIRINPKHIPKLRYVAAYQVAPRCAITHLAEVAKVEPYEKTGKYLIAFKKPAVKIAPIPRTADSEINMQSPRYALRDKLLAAKTLDQVWS